MKKKVKDILGRGEGPDSVDLFKETRGAISKILVRLDPWLGYRIDDNLTIGGILKGLNKTLISIQERSLYGALEEWIKGFCEKHESMGVKVSFRQLGVKPAMSDVVKNELIYVFQEACGNAVKHGEADVIQILFLYQKDSIKVTISDNGNGVESIDGLSNEREGSGIDSIRTRIRKLGGVLEFGNKLGETGTGFVLIASLPTGGGKVDVEGGYDASLGHELHDYLCPEMIGVVMLFASIRRKLTEDESEMWYEIQCAEESLSEYSTRFRTLSHELIK